MFRILFASFCMVRSFLFINSSDQFPVLFLLLGRGQTKAPTQNPWVHGTWLRKSVGCATGATHCWVAAQRQPSKRWPEARLAERARASRPELHRSSHISHCQVTLAARCTEANQSQGRVVWCSVGSGTCPGISCSPGWSLLSGITKPRDRRKEQETDT